MQNFNNNLKSLESEDFKTELDVQSETLAAKDGDPLDIFNELINIDKMSPQMLKTILEYLSSSNKNIIADDLTKSLKQDEQCT